MATKQTFVVWAPYHTDPEALARRSVVRPEHLEGVKRLIANGSWKAGGPASDPVSGEPTGSMFVVEEENIASLRAILEKDAYWVNNVWDKERFEIKVITLIPANQAS